MSPLSVDVISSEGIIWSGTASYVSVPGVSGEFGVLPGHQPIVSLLREGQARIIRDGQGTTLTVPIHSGLVFVEGDEVTILPDNHAQGTAGGD